MPRRLVWFNPSAGGGAVTGAGTAAGIAAATAVAVSIFAATGTATGTGAASGVGTGVVAATGSAAGTSTASGAGVGVTGSTGSSTGTGTASGVGASIFAATGTAAGTGAASAATTATAASAGTATGTSTVSGVSPVTTPSVLFFHSVDTQHGWISGEYMSWSAVNIFITNTGARTGGQRHVYNGAVYAERNGLSFSGNQALVGVGFTFPTATAGARDLISIKEGSTVHLTLALNASDQLCLYRGDVSTGTLLVTGSTTLSTATWYYVELKCTIDDSGSADFAINGTSDLVSPYSGDTKNGGTAALDTVRFGYQTTNDASGDSFFDDYYISDPAGVGVTDFLGSTTKVFGRDYGSPPLATPTADGSSTDWTPSTGTDHYALVDDASSSDGAYVESSTAGHKDYYTIKDLPSGNTVHAVRATVFAQYSSGSGVMRMLAKHSASEATSSDVTLTASLAQYSRYFHTNPSTGNKWTVSEFNASEWGIEVVSGSPRVEFVRIEALVSTEATTVTAAGTAAGTGAASGVGASTYAATGTAAGTGAATGAGNGVFGSVGSSDGTSTVTGVGSSSGASTGAAAGTGAASGVGASTAAATGSSTGTGAASGVGASGALSDGSAAGTGAASGVGASTAESTGTAAGTSDATAVNADGGTVGTAAGTSTVTGVGDILRATGAGSSTGTSTATASSSQTGSGAGSSTGTGTATGVSPQGAGTSEGTATVTGVGASVAGAVGTAAGVGAATATGLELGPGEATGNAYGTSTAEAYSPAVYHCVECLDPVVFTTIECLDEIEVVQECVWNVVGVARGASSATGAGATV